MSARLLSRLVVTSVIGVGIGAVSLLAPPAASALDSSSVSLSALSLSAGKPMTVTIKYLYSATSCTLAITGGTAAPAKAYPVRDGEVTARLSTARLRPGRYAVRAVCGKDGRATSNPFVIVPNGEPTSATCDVTDKGFSVNTYEMEYGVQVTNRSSVLTATDVALAINWLSASGAVLQSTEASVSDIAPGESMLAGGGINAVPGVASITVASLCKSGVEKPGPRQRGQATWIKERSSDYWPTEFGGTMTNALPFTVSEDSWIWFVTREASGRITGGGSTSPDAFLPPGGTSTWRAMVAAPIALVSSVDWVMLPRERV